MIRIATIAAAEYDWSHGTTFTQIVNGCSKSAADLLGVKYVPPGRPVAPDARVVAIWTPDRERSELLAKYLRIPDVLARPDEAVGHVDAAICCDDGCEKRVDRNGEWAIPYITVGIPTFLDKPLSHSARQADEIVSLARRKNAPILSCSGFRYAPEVLREKERLSDLGDLVAAQATGPLGWLLFYGVHPLDTMISLFGIGAQWVRHLGTKGHDVLHIGYHDGRTMLLQSLSRMAYSFHFSLFGTKDSRQFSIVNSKARFGRQVFHANTMKQFLEMVRTGQMPVSYDEMLEVAKILTYGRASRENAGKRLELDLRPPN